jgi:hypothetical protein
MNQALFHAQPGDNAVARQPFGVLRCVAAERV